MTAAAQIEVPAVDPMAAVRALNRMRQAGFTLELDGAALAVSPADRLNDAQRQFIRQHKPELLDLLHDAETLHAALVNAGSAGLNWHEGTPADWSDIRLLAAGEALYGDGRMVNWMCRRYLRECALPLRPYGGEQDE